jgi:signal transduction histidine kinase
MTRALRGIGLFALLAAGGAILSASGLLAPLDRPLEDSNLRLLALLRRPPAAPVACVVLGERSFRRIPSGLLRPYLAAVVRAAQAQRPLGIALDVLLPEDNGAAESERLAATLAAQPAVVATALDEDPPHRWILPDRAFRRQAAAHVVVEPDEDGVFRRMSAFKQSEGVSLPALPIAAARFARPDLAFVVGDPLIPDFAQGPDVIPVVDAENLLRQQSLGAAAPAGTLAAAADPAAPPAAAPPTHRLLAGRIVLIGAAAAGASDRVYLPTRRGLPPVPGVEALAAVTASILSGGLLRTLPPLGAGPLLAAAVLAVLGWRRWRGGFGLPQVVLALLAVEAASLAALHVARLVLPAASVLAVVGVTALAAAAAESAAVRRHTRHLLAELAAVTGAGQPGDGAGLPQGAVERLGLLRELHGNLRLEGDRRRETQRLITHELKTPLTSLAGFGRMLERYQLDSAERQRVAGLIRMESERLGKMVTTLLELENVAANRAELAPRRLDVAALVKERCAVLRAAAEGRGQSLRLELAGAPAGVVGDRELLGRVVDNLVGNAIQHGRPGSEIQVRLAAEGGAAVLQVSDQGPGIAADDLPRVFERFFRGRNASGGGAGLGLALVREAVERHGGTVGAESAPAAGSTFWISIPLQQPSEVMP